MKVLTIEQLRADRQAAGLTYEDACLRYTAAWTNLLAHDVTLNNTNVRRKYGLPSFAQLATEVPVHLSLHPDFISNMDNALPHILAATARKRQDNLLANLAN